MELISTETTSDQDVQIQVQITNTDEFVAFQFELMLPSALNFISGSAQLNPERVTDHVIQEYMMPGRTLRIFSYSPTNTPFTGNNGVVVSFTLHSGFEPGDYFLQLLNPIIGDINSENILTGTVDGTVTILCPDIAADPLSLDFGSIPLLDSTDRQLMIQNSGNQDLIIENISFNSPYFSVVGNPSYTIPGGQSIYATIRFCSIVKGNYQKIITITSNDPDGQIINIPLSAVAFPVNEVHCGDIFCYSGHEATLTLSINNMEPFTGFQFDLQLPASMSYIPNSAVLSTRKTNHIVSANIVSPNVLRVVAFSNDNQTFTGNDGDIVFLDFNIAGIGGFYSLSLDNVIIGDESGLNCISAFYNGQLEIAAADISASDFLDIGSVSILDTGQSDLSIFNYGTDTLKISTLIFTNSHFYSSVSLPIDIDPGNSSVIRVFFHQNIKGQAQGKLKIYSNDPDESPYIVDLTALAYNPNVMFVEDAVTGYQSIVTINVNADNYEDFVAFQFDLEFPNIVSYLPGSCKLTSRAQGHLVQATLIDSTHLRIFSYSMQQKAFLGNSGAIASVDFQVNTDYPDSYLISLENAILGNQYSQNILYGTESGQLTILDPNYYHVIDIPEGWSGISSYVKPNDSLVENIFSPVVSDLTILMSMNKVYWPDQNINTVIYWDTQTGYKIKVTNAIQLIMVGNTVVDKSVYLPGGWYILPVLSQYDVSTLETDILSSLGDTLTIVKDIGGNKIYWPDQQIFTLQFLVPGKSYSIHTTQSCSINYPVNSQPNKSVNISETEDYEIMDSAKVIPTPNSHIIAFDKSISDNLMAGDIIGCYTLDNICAGLVKICNNRKNFALTVFGDDLTTTELKEGFNENELMTFKIYRSSTHEEFRLIPVFSNSLPNCEGRFVTDGLSKIEEVSLLNISETENSLGFIVLCPNPAREFVTIYFNNTNREDIEFDIYSSNGDCLKHEKLKTLLNIRLNINDFKPGIYFLRFLDHKESLIKKLVVY